MLGRTQADQYIGRSSGPFGIPNSLGVFMALLIPPVGAQAFGPGRTRAVRDPLRPGPCCAGRRVRARREPWRVAGACSGVWP